MKATRCGSFTLSLAFQQRYELLPFNGPSLAKIWLLSSRKSRTSGSIMPLNALQYVTVIPNESTKQGSRLLRFLWGDAGTHAVRRDPELKRFCHRKLFRKVWGKHAWPWHGSSGSAYGSCCAMKSIIESSVVVDRSKKAVPPVRGCQKRGW